MRERPINFRINPASPLARNAVFLGLGQHPYTGHYRDASVYGNHGTLTGYSGAGDTPADRWTWDSTLKRQSLRAAESSNSCVEMPRGWASTPEMTFIVWSDFFYKTQNYLFYPNTAVCTLGMVGTALYWGEGFSANSATLDTSSYYASSPHLCACRFRNSIWSLTFNGTTVEHAASVSTVAASAFNVLNDYSMARPWKVPVSDVLLIASYVSDDIISALADPSNIDLRIGNVPLILPPVRRLWPAGVASTPPVANRPRRISYIGMLGT